VNKEAPTIQAVLLHAARLRAEAEAIIRRDYWADVYKPTDAAAKRLAQLCSSAREKALTTQSPAATKEQREAARALGPGDAIQILTYRAQTKIREYREDKRHSEEREQRHRSFQTRQQKARERERSGQTIGERIDQALRDLAVVSGVTASNIQGDVVTGSKEHDGVDISVFDPVRRAKAIAERAMREIEAEVDEARRRRVELEAA